MNLQSTRSKSCETPTTAATWLAIEIVNRLANRMRQGACPGLHGPDKLIRYAFARKVIVTKNAAYTFFESSRSVRACS